MTDKISDLLEAAAGRAAPVVAGVRDADLGAPTPCADYRVRDLLNHLFQVVVNFQELAAKREADFSTTPDYLGDDWRPRFAHETSLLVQAWAQPGAEEGTSRGMGLPARTVGAMALLDLTVHAWDLARSTGGSFVPDEGGLDELEGLVERMGPTGRSMKVFGEPVPVAPRAGRFAALLAATGRDPAWRPPVG